MQEINNDAMYPYKLFFYDCIWEGNKIIYPAANCNAICETDISTGETIVIGKADEKTEGGLFHGIYKWKEYLILASREARSALNFFNTENNKWSYINIDESKKDWLNFRGTDVFEYNGYLYAFSALLVVLKISIENMSIDYLFYPDIKPDNDVRGEIICINDMIYIPMRHSRKIYKFDLVSEQWTLLEVNTELRGIETLCYNGKLFWMTGIGEMICSWDEKSNTSVSYKNFPPKFKKLFTRKSEDGFWFIRSVVYDNSVYFIPADANMVIEFNIIDHKAKEVFIKDEWEEEADMRIGRPALTKYMVAQKKDSVLMMFSNKNKNLIFIDLDAKKIKKIELKLCIKNGLDKLILDTSVRREGIIDLRMWLKCLGASEQQYSKTNESKEENTGRKIYFSC